jgi:hypothetical protein
MAFLYSDANESGPQTSERKGARVDPLLFIVGRNQPDLHDYLTTEFRRDDQIQIIVDRRLADRRRRVEPHPLDQRRTARRRELAMEEQIRSVGVAMVRYSLG